MQTFSPWFLSLDKAPGFFYYCGHEMLQEVNMNRRSNTIIFMKNAFESFYSTPVFHEEGGEKCANM